jgi:hypothetical protein
MDKIQKNNFTDYKAPSSEPFRLKVIILFKISSSRQYWYIVRVVKINENLKYLRRVQNSRSNNPHFCPNYCIKDEITWTEWGFNKRQRRRGSGKDKGKQDC